MQQVHQGPYNVALTVVHVVSILVETVIPYFNKQFMTFRKTDKDVKERAMKLAAHKISSIDDRRQSMVLKLQQSSHNQGGRANMRF